jgi:methionyl-tRNA formyltransferase
MGLMIYILSTRKEEINKTLRDFKDSFYLSDNLDFVSQIDPKKKNFLIAHNTNLIVPSDVLSIFDACFNIHAASPDFPGRDPHHWAIYYNATNYGATLHKMEEKVDAGQIILYKSFNCCKEDTPLTLLNRANAISMDIMRFAIIELIENLSISNIFGTWVWGKKKKTRKDLLAITDCSNDSEEEIINKIKAFSHPKHANLYIKKGEYTFYLLNEKK